MAATDGSRCGRPPALRRRAVDARRWILGNVFIFLGCLLEKVDPSRRVAAFDVVMLDRGGCESGGDLGRMEE